MHADTNTARKTTAVDHLVGARVRLRRQSLGMSQTELGEKIGVTFQQLQKYETGANRIGASRLVSIAGALGVPITFFFEELKPAGEPADENDPVMVALRDRMTVELIKAFAALPSPILRRCILDFVRTASGSETPEQVEATEPVKEPLPQPQSRKRATGKR